MMKCPMCGVQLEDNAQMCNTCGCSIVYNGHRDNALQMEMNAAKEQKGTPNFKRIAIIASVSVAVLIVLILLVKGGSPKTSSDTGADYAYTPNTAAKTTAGANTPGNPYVYDWMEDQAQGNNYDYDDGGDYYCMGKNDTCPNKTHNKYDLYCNSCDPNGDNIEG